MEVVGTLYIKDNKLLLNKPRKRPTYQLVAGKIELNETPLEAIIRESHEELGKSVTFNESAFEFIMDFNEIASSDNKTEIHYYLFKYNGMLDGTLETSEEIESFLWYDTSCSDCSYKGSQYELHEMYVKIPWYKESETHHRQITQCYHCAFSVSSGKYHTYPQSLYTYEPVDETLHQITKYCDTCPQVADGGTANHKFVVGEWSRFDGSDPNAGTYDCNKYHKRTLTCSDCGYVKYEYVAPSEALAIFSEVYFPEGWSVTVDGEPAEYFAADYILRGMVLPEGEHTVAFRYENKAFSLGWKVSLVCAAVLAALYVYMYKPKKTGHTKGKFEK